jgi:hypothetical protein
MSITTLSVHLQRRPEVVMPFAMDSQVFEQNALDGLVLSGWVIHPAYPVREVQLGRENEVLASAVPGRLRPGATAAYRGLPGSAKPGFSLTLEQVEAGDYWLAVIGPQGQEQRFADVHLRENSRPQLFYMHIAKAGGSTVNRYLLGHYDERRARVHIESAPEWPQNAKLLEGYDFLSGHISLRALDAQLDARRFRLVTVVREPWSHLVSHLAWVRRLAEPGEERRLKAHSAPIQAFALKLAQCDFAEAASVHEMVTSLGQEERIIVDNCQVRYFAKVPGPWATAADLEEAIGATSRFEHIGLTGDLDGFFAAVASSMGWPEPAAAGRENVSGNFFGLEDAGEDVKAALRPLICFDEQLYAAILEQRG